MGRNTLLGPGYGDVDLAFLKNIPIKERIHAQLRIELFNVFNRVNLAPPSGTLAAGLDSLPTLSATITVLPASAPASHSTRKWR